MAKSPFPGMDPFLEHDWLDVHSALVTYIRDQIQDQLPQDLLARMESRVLVEDSSTPEPSSDRHSDVRVVETRSNRGQGAAILDEPHVAVAEPDMFVVEVRSEPATQRYIEIVDAATRTRVITTIELISPTNKRPGIGQRLYLKKREECLAAAVNVVEIDLTRGGNRLSILPAIRRLDSPPTYVACVRRRPSPTHRRSI